VAHKNKYTFSCIFAFTKIAYLDKIAENKKFPAKRKGSVAKPIVLIDLPAAEGAFSSDLLGMTIYLRGDYED
jgi:hypothetical protein